MKSKIISEILCANMLKERSGGTRYTHERQNTWFRSFRLTAQTTVCHMNSISATHARTHTQQWNITIWTNNTHTPHICETHTHMCVIARVHSTHKARTHTATAGEKTSLFMSICVLDLIIWYVSMCVCCPIEVMAMNKDRKITTKMKWNEHKSQSSMAQEKMIYRLECLFSYSEW